MALKPVLVLNADFNPLSVIPLSTCSWQDAMSQYFKGKCDIAATYDTWLIRSEKLSLKVPAVIVTKEFKRVGRRVQFSKENIALRDGYRCSYCNLDLLANKHIKFNFDHVLPRSKGGKTDFANICLSCEDCNHSKGDNEKIVPKIPPYKPDFYELLSKVRMYPTKVLHKSWIDYLGWDPNLVTVINHKFSHLETLDLNDDIEVEIDDDFTNREKKVA